MTPLLAHDAEREPARADGDDPWPADPKVAQVTILEASSFVGDGLLPVVAAALVATAAYVAFARRHRPGWQFSIVLLLSVAELAATHWLLVHTVDHAWKLFWYKMYFVGFTVAPGAFLLASLDYARQTPMSSATWCRLGVIPAVTAAAILTNEYHGWMWVPERTTAILRDARFLHRDDAGVLYWPFVAYCYAVILAGFYFFLRLFGGSRGLYGRQALAIVFGGSIATVGTVLDVSGLSPFPPFVITGAGVATTAVLVVLGLSALERMDLLLVSRRAVFESMGDAIVVVDELDRVVEMNPAAARIADRAATRRPRQALQEVLPEQVLLAGESEDDRHKVILGSGESSRTYDVGISAVMDQRGRQRGRVIVLRDITDLEAASREMARLNAELEDRVHERTRTLEAANHDLEAFAYSVSHDLRGPLRVIDGHSLILLEDYGSELDDVGRRACGVVRDQTHRLGELIDSLLSFSRVGRVKVEPTPLDMNALAASALDQLSIGKNDGAMDCRIDDLPPAFGDAVLLHQVWTNLLSNAIKFSSARDRPEVRVRSARADGEIVYTVTDNGIGFEMAHARKLFGVFQRLQADGEFPGVGVGLAIVQRIVNKHGGRVWADAEVDGGASFHFSLPLGPLEHHR